MITPREKPCPSCPYRQDVPSGIWDTVEYAKLIEYDKLTSEQPVEIFHCHSTPEQICAGWLGCHGQAPHDRDLLALRLGVVMGRVDPAVFEYDTDTPLFRSGAEAAEHGLRDFEAPSPEARRHVASLMRRLRRLSEQRADDSQSERP